MSPTSDVLSHQMTGSDPAVRARTAVGAGQRRLLAELRPKVAMLTELELGADAREAALATLTDFCTGHVRRHLDAADRALYAPVADAPEARLLVRALRAAAGTLGRDIDALTRIDDARRAKAVAQALQARLAMHFAVEQTVLVPALAALPGIEPAALAEDFARLLGGGSGDGFEGDGDGRPW